MRLWTIFTSKDETDEAYNTYERKSQTENQMNRYRYTVNEEFYDSFPFCLTSSEFQHLNLKTLDKKELCIQGKKNEANEKFISKLKEQ